MSKLLEHSFAHSQYVPNLFGCIDDDIVCFIKLLPEGIILIHIAIIYIIYEEAVWMHCIIIYTKQANKRIRMKTIKKNNKERKKERQRENSKGIKKQLNKHS